jgi:hypothetical protein
VRVVGRLLLLVLVVGLGGIVFGLVLGLLVFLGLVVGEVGFELVELFGELLEEGHVCEVFLKRVGGCCLMEKAVK